ncbi:clathrin associated protein complex large subunit [Blyttiomyces sp. JEL0837]|nr:clathrin associated protein complex large subunit [Blyttiomyces sp. JEL0837]
MEKILTKLIIPRLKDLIKSIRACKTAAEERAVIAKESAFIRTSFKEENVDTRYINVQKLLYIHMLGYPAHFGQMECLKLVASPRFADKRLGYLGIMLLLDENQEVLTLVTNSLKNDMNNSNMYIVGLALVTLGNISSTEMSRDLCGEVEKLLNSSHAFVRKKAALCALRIVKKVPDLMENFANRAKSLLNERNHSVLLTGVTLLIDMCNRDPELLNDVRSSVPILVRHLKNLVSAGFSPEHDVSGITDPFLQVKILRLLRILGKGNVQASEEMNDILAQVATNTEGSKNVGNAILYESVLTIMDIESENSLRVMAINILGKFLSNKDNNIRYVALTTLTKTAQMAPDSSSLQRHRATILDCLRDPDISIRRRALDLSFFLINGQNIRILTRELLSFLEVAEGDIKSSTASRICDFAGRYRPNRRWEVDTVIRVLRVAGAYVDQSTVNHFVKMISTANTDLQQYAVRKLYNIVRLEGDLALMQEGLLQAMGWCVGEFGDLLVGGGVSSFGVVDEEEPASGAGAGLDGSGDYQAAPGERDVVELFDLILRGPFATSAVKEYFVTALAKLLGRFQQEAVLELLRTIIAKYRSHGEVEIQARAVEYMAIAGLDRETRVALLEKMPVLESAVKEEALKGTGSSATQEKPASASAASSATKATPNILDVGNDLLGLSMGTSAAVPAAAKGDDLLNLMFGGGGASAAAPAMSAAAAKNDIMDLFGGSMGMSSGSAITPAATAAAPKGGADLLGDLFGGGGLGGGGASVPAAKPAVVASNPMDDLFGGLSGAASAKAYPAYEKNGLRVSLVPTREMNGAALSVVARFESSGSVVSGLSFQVAVPKALRLTMQPPSSTTISPGSSATQMLKIENPSKMPVKLRIKLSYSVNGQGVDEIVDFGGFDSSLWA